MYKRQKLIGMTYPKDHISYVWAPWVLNHGADGYELRLQIMHMLFPGQSEDDDINWMSENGVLR